MSGAASPCTGVCTYDARLGRCLGCARTLDEIAAWPDADEDRRRAIAAAAAHRAAHSLPVGEA